MATRRTRTANKVDIPSIEDAVSKLDHMGRETVKKLQDLRMAALQAGMEIDVPENTVCKGTLQPAPAATHAMLTTCGVLHFLLMRVVLKLDCCHNMQVVTLCICAA